MIDTQKKYLDASLNKVIPITKPYVSERTQSGIDAFLEFYKDINLKTINDFKGNVDDHEICIIEKKTMGET